ncbi:hypothetical protein [Sphingobacterium athyrii]|uniref:DUF4412 domain-containing protein n=1 Tax=Sphingobacterium athyrii TaxID=2152717 RepID=A0A363NWE4_9SPHI|nr:hypothetical protein [Sphingobacterium athyrii]PUV25125.1 hypothetical protein DCO56_09290 [Sphingobacterium athyrii]
MKKFLIISLLFLGLGKVDAQNIEWLNSQNDKVKIHFDNIFIIPSSDFQYNVNGVKIIKSIGDKKTISILWNQIEDIEKQKISNYIQLEFKKSSDYTIEKIGIEFTDVALKNEYYKKLIDLTTKAGVKMPEKILTIENKLEEILEGNSYQNKLNNETTEEVVFKYGMFYWKMGIKNDGNKKKYLTYQAKLNDISKVEILKEKDQTFIAFHYVQGGGVKLPIKGNDSEKATTLFKDIQNKYRDQK